MANILPLENIEKYKNKQIKTIETEILFRYQSYLLENKAHPSSKCE